MTPARSMESTAPSAPSNSSKLCLSCHDGTLAIGAVNVLNGFTTGNIPMSGTGGGGEIPDGSGTTTGYTRNLGIDLSNDHPISITYNTALATADGELYDPASVSHVGTQGSTPKPALPIITDLADSNVKVECVSCHDPHVRDDSGDNIKFLRLNRFQTNAGPVTVSSFNSNNDIICLGCHSKEGWVDSAHANELVADETYAAVAAGQRDFPTSNFPVWRAACLNCHDTHTVQGFRRLLREGTDDTNTPKAGGNPAIEETCYQCHSGDGATLTSQGFGTSVPNIKSDFSLAYRMPIATSDQSSGTEIHDIGNSGSAGDGKDFIETAANLGKGNLLNRHAECTDCHNPHRVIKNRLANATPGTADAAGTHTHNSSTMHTNIASGVLRGMWGVEPVYSKANFDNVIPGITYTVKKGTPPTAGTMNATDSYVTREYQICLKCHSDFAYDSAPTLGYTGGTTSGTNGITQYTNQAMEFQAPVPHMGEVTTVDSGAPPHTAPTTIAAGIP